MDEKELKAEIEKARKDNRTSLNLSGRQLTTLPESIGQLQSLQGLYLDNNELTALPESIGQLQSLVSLHLHNNKLTTLPESIGQLQSLRTLVLNNNALTTLPESIGQLQSLESLDLWGNGLTTLPESIGQLQSLEWLFLLNNKLTTLPESIGQLQSLVWLHLDNNELTTLPRQLSGMPSLRTVNLKGNPELEAQGLAFEEISGKDLTAILNQIPSAPESRLFIRSVENVPRNEADALLLYFKYFKDFMDKKFEDENFTTHIKVKNNEIGFILEVDQGDASFVESEWVGFGQAALFGKPVSDIAPTSEAQIPVSALIAILKALGINISDMQSLTQQNPLPQSININIDNTSSAEAKNENTIELNVQVQFQQLHQALDNLKPHAAELPISTAEVDAIQSELEQAKTENEPGKVNKVLEKLGGVVERIKGVGETVGKAATLTGQAKDAVNNVLIQGQQLANQFGLSGLAEQLQNLQFPI